MRLGLGIGSGGSPLTALSLEINGGGTSSDDYAEVSTYDGAAMQEVHTLTIVDDSLVLGTIYKLRYRARNAEVGFGPYSDVVLVALNAVPPAPPAPARVESGCTESSIAVSWPSSEPSPALEGNRITGYRLYAAREQSNVYSLVYDGTGFPQATSTVISGLAPGGLYDFRVSALNFNGEGPASAVALRTHSCVPPSGLRAPVRVPAESTASSITLAWEEPEATGGCPITGYAVFRNDPDLADPASGLEVWVEANSAYDTNIRDKPQLFRATVTNYPGGSTGTEFKYVVEAFNAVGGALGTAASFVLATAPSAPQAAPQVVDSMTSSTQVTLTISALVGDAETGGAPILSYALQRSTNSAAEPAAFLDESGASGDSLALQHTVYDVEKGRTYSFRYRARNQYGWSAGWSPTLYVTASDAPAAPPAPTLVAATDTAVTVALTLPSDDGGLPVRSLELLRDNGDRDGAPIDVPVATYDPYSFSLQHQLTTTLDGIVTGKIYSFATRATNAKGASGLSGRLQAAVASPPARPAAPSVDRTRSGETSLLLRWAAVPDDPGRSPGGDITGYELLLATPESGEGFTAVLDSVGSSTQATELLAGPPALPLTTGSVYRFKLALHNFNGASLPSEVRSFRVCAPPSGLAKPFKVGSATAPALSITVGWRAPASSGGCPILGYAVYVDDGAAGAFVEANTEDDPLVRGQPTLRQLQITRVSALGATYRVKVTAFTEAGDVTSPALGVVLASLPLKPPTPLLLASSSARTALDISGFPASSNGGCPITSFDIQRDDGHDGPFQSLVGLSSPYLMGSLTVAQSQATPIVRGRMYKFRYRARNCVGWGPLSEELQALAADPPLAPPSPTRASTSATSITLLLYPTRDNGGSAVTGYELYRNDGDGGTDFFEVASYDYPTLGFQATLVLAAESMTAGRSYQFQFRASNVMGHSEFSAVATFPVADPPAKPAAAPWRISSTKLHIAVAWDRAADTQAPAGTITGHYLYMDDGAGGDFSLVFSGAGFPDLTQYSVTGAAISTGDLYRFYLVSENHVGLSAAASDISAFRACEAPTGLAPPTRVATSETSVSVAWSPPADDGGCSVTGYALLVGAEALAGAGDALSFAEVHAADVRDRPSLNSFTVTALPSGVAPGAALRFKLAAFNQGGFSTTSERSLRVILASVPSAPAAAAASDPAVTSGSVLKVTYTPPASDGGSPISNYEVQMDDGVGGGFQTLAGGDGDPYLKHYFIAHGGGVCSHALACEITLAGVGLDGEQYTQVVTSMALVKGRTYRLRYRAANAIGWSDWSPVSHVQAAKEPEAPPAPTVLASSSGAIEVRVNPSLENNGAAIDHYTLYIDGGSLSSAYQAVSAYDGQAETYTLSAADGIASGERYRIVTTAWNVHGESPQSREAWAAAGSAPAQPARLRRAAALSTRTQIVVEWSVEPDTELPITGYVLEWDAGEGEGVFAELWNGRGRPEVLSFAVGLTTGTEYRFRHKALNFNGESPYSDVLEAYACESPSPPGRPTWVTSSLTAITLAWERSVDDGGCPVLEYRLYRDAGDGSGLADVEVQAGDLRGNPLATGAVVAELPTGAVGHEFVFRLKVYTDFSLLETGDGVWGAPSRPILYAGVPGAPANAPRRGALSGATALAADVDAVLESNGSPVQSYEVQIDDGLGGAFIELQGGLAASLSLSASKATGVVQGRYYRVRYRARNAIGDGPFSPTTYILAAEPPAVLPVSGAGGQLAASIIGSDLVVRWGLPPNGGSEVLEGLLEIRESDGATFAEESTHCALAEDSAAFDGRACSIPLAALRLDSPSTNSYQLAQGQAIALRIRFRNEVGWGPGSSVFTAPGLLMETVPHEPLLGPHRLDASTLGTQVGVGVTALSGLETGGSPILSYEV